jgi:hypothetical protein
MKTARNSRGSGFTTWQTRQNQSPKKLAGCGVTSGRRFGLAQFSNGLYFLMISPNLHAIWVCFLLNFCQDFKFFILLYFGTLGDGYSLKGSKK